MAVVCKIHKPGWSVIRLKNLPGRASEWPELMHLAWQEELRMGLRAGIGELNDEPVPKWVLSITDNADARVKAGKNLPSGVPYSLFLTYIKSTKQNVLCVPAFQDILKGLLNSSNLSHCQYIFKFFN